MFACCSPFAYGTKKGTLQDKFYKPTFDQDPFEKVNFSLEHYLNRKGTHKMMIFIEKSLVFFATPKTGSTAYHQALGHKAEMFFSKSNQVKHITPKRFNETFRPFVSTLMPEPPTTVAVIRDPIEWLGSWYRYRSRNDMRGHPNSTAHLSFDDFANAYMSEPQPDCANVGSQALFLTGGETATLVEQIWRYDALNDLTLFLSLRLQHEFHLNPWNVSPTGDTTLSPKTERALKSYFQADYDLYENAIGAP